MNNYTICMYDLDDNYICEFASYKECAEYFDTNVKVIHTYICKSKKGIIDKKKDKIHKRFVRLVKWPVSEE